jgi:hypothetical protein
MGRMSKAKGKRGERECASELRELLGCDARRGVQYQGGPDSPDVVLKGLRIHVECKRVERLDLYGAMRQAIDDAGDDVPIVWHRKNNEESVCVVQTSDLLRLAREIVASQDHRNTES